MTTLETAPLSENVEARIGGGAAAARWRWLLTWTGRMAEFALVQSLVQLLTAIAGLIVLRTLAKEQYALYAIANTMQTTAGMLAELGIGMGVKSIGGRVWQERARFSQLLVTAIKLRHTFAAASLTACLPVAAWMLFRNGAGGTLTALLCATIVAGTLPQLSKSVLIVALGLHGRYRKIQRANLGNAALRAGGSALLGLSYMNAWLACALAAVSEWITLFRVRQFSGEVADFQTSSHDGDRREILRLSTRVLPNTLFFCFQGQVTLLILSWFGNAGGIADVTALGRLSALLMVFSASVNQVLVPRFARCQDARRLPKLYFGLLASCTTVLVPVVVLGWLAPGPLLWLLGAKYAGLENECGWVVSTACVSQLAAMMYQLNTSRAWVRVGPFLFIPLTLTAQAVALMFLDVSQVHGVVLFAFVTSIVPLVSLVADMAIGMRRFVQEAGLGGGL
jgi:O-antigen/teichoic acid export membrane protein